LKGQTQIPREGKGEKRKVKNSLSPYNKSHAPIPSVALQQDLSGNTMFGHFWPLDAAAHAAQKIWVTSTRCCVRSRQTNLFFFI
jgi:hypothetical protein